MALFRDEQTRVAEFAQHPANHHRVRPRMGGDVGGGAHALGLPGHVAEGVERQRQAAIALHRLSLIGSAPYVTNPVAFI